MNKEMRISRERGVPFIEKWECFVPYWYDDKAAPHHVGGKLVYPRLKPGDAVRGTATIGFGHTKAAAGHWPFDLNAPDMTLEQANELLDADLAPVERFLNRVIKVDMTQGQFDATGSCVFNIGEGNFERSTILRKLNAGDYEGARAAFDRFTYSKGEHMVGLQRRRDAEQALWSEHPNLAAHMPDDGEIVEHPAEVDPANARTMVKSTEGWTATAQTIGGGGGIAEQTSDAWDMADKAIDAKDKAEALGIEPIKLFDKLNETLAILIHKPAFWFCVAVAAAGVYLWLRRRYRLKQEN